MTLTIRNSIDKAPFYNAITGDKDTILFLFHQFQSITLSYEYMFIEPIDRQKYNYA